MNKDATEASEAGAQPVCSVCIANYNGIGLIDACIASVRAQDCGFSVEIIVHDDASTDDSVRHIRQRHADVILIASDVNVGFCQSNNRMADVARGRYILLLNNDAELLPDALSSLYQAASELGRSAVLGLPQYNAATGELIDVGSRFDLFLNAVPAERGTKACGIIGACMWLDRQLWHELGGFPAWFGSLAEDTYLSCLARLLGHEVAALPHSGFRHWVGQSLGGGKVMQNRLSTSRTRRAATERNKNFAMMMLYPAPALQLLLPLHALLLLAEGLVLAILKRDVSLFRTIYLGSLAALWSNRSLLARERRRIQAGRKIAVGAFFAPFQRMPHKLQMLLSYGVPELR